MKIRPAQIKDADAIAGITNAIIRETLITFTTSDRTIDSIAVDIETRGAAYLVAEQDGQAIGFATYGPFRGGPGYARTMEHSIQLAPEARGQGVGQRLMTELELVAVGQGIHVLVAGVSSANPGGVAFHRHCGFEEVGRMPEVGRKWGQWLDLVLMQKILARASIAAPDSRRIAR